MNNKDKFLGMPIGTAQNRLRKMVLFDLLRRHNENICYRCKKEIENINDLSIEHKISWLGISKELFWDLNNVAFSHMKCNFSEPRIINRKIGQDGTAWCCDCKTFLPLDNFASDKSRWNELNNRCKICDVKKGILYRSKK